MIALKWWPVALLVACLGCCLHAWAQPKPAKEPTEDPESIYLQTSDEETGAPTYRNLSDDEVIRVVGLLKVFDHGEFSGGIATKFPDGRPREVVFAGKRNKVVVRPGETKFAEMPRACRVFFWQAGEAPEGVGDEESELKFTHVRCSWLKDGTLTWQLYGPEPLFSADKAKTAAPK